MPTDSNWLHGNGDGNTKPPESYNQSWITKFQVNYNEQPCLNATITVYYSGGEIYRTYHVDDQGQVCCWYSQEMIKNSYVPPKMDLHCFILADHDNPDSKSRDDTLTFILGDYCPNNVVTINLDE